MMNRFQLFSLAVAYAMICGVIQAKDQQNPNGTWKWTVTREDNVDVNFSLKLKHADDKLTGTITLPNKQDLEIEDASFKNDEVAFTVIRKGPKDRKVTTKFKGKLDGDTIKGTRETTPKEIPNSSGKWEPKRDKE